MSGKKDILNPKDHIPNVIPPAGMRPDRRLPVTHAHRTDDMNLSEEFQWRQEHQQ